ncbi:hypothetical protein K435DRAFT_811731 [Dendrothele bispora CBS 962.96]|uniref:F-box domain-containing protein n=1 Tax=Dendrothele bispora (strain CBS 962.96) TaxID=1314807 RepID=A0A4V4HB69_DENBC|nr:hypothetical protein K435DRAFT_811731 [Dendrothele bispora CBS 962.96]
MLKSESAEQYRNEKWQELRNRTEQTRLGDPDFQIIRQLGAELFTSTFALEFSRFEPLFNINYSPFESEVEELKKIIHGPSQELARIEDEISRLESILIDLKSKRNTITAYIENHRALLSPFSSSLSRNPLRNLYRKLTGVDEWLKRSGGLPIALSIFCPRKTSQYILDEENSGRVTPVGAAAIDVFICQLAEKYSHRLKRLDLTLPWNAMSIIMSLKPVDIPMLESLSITHSSFHGYGLNDIVDFIKKIPTLRELKLNHHPLLLEQFIYRIW